jgi:SAM-dependent methyltransferase
MSPMDTKPRRDLIEGMLEIRHVESREASREAYDALYQDVRIANLVRHLDRLLDLADARPGMALLDVAGGDGALVRRARERGVAAQGVDLSLVAQKQGLREMPTGSLVLGDGECLPFASGRFDRVTSIGSLEHYEDMPAGVREMKRVLRPDGLALILVPNSFGLRWNVLHAWTNGDIHDDGQPIQRYGTRVQWTRLLEAGGLRPVRTLGIEKEDDLPAGPAEWARMLRHPSRWLIPFSRYMPVNMASMLVFICERSDSVSRDRENRSG